LPVITSGLPTGTRDFQQGKDGQPGTLLYTFKQDIPIASYLFSIASGDIATAAIGPRSLVATGPEELEASKWEFEEHMEPYLQAAEKTLQTVPYAWTTYNVLVLPPSFPYGGMETPVFTLATPTLISGDRENVNVVAHELAHSWSGNLVSNASWEHMWINEGWTVYLERRIQAEIDGEAHRGFHGIIGWKALTDSINHFGVDHEFTQMVVKLDGKDPDDAFSSVFYEKGYVFLLHLETLLGKDKFDSFIPHYFSTWARKSLDSDEFKATILDFFKNDDTASKQLKELDWDKWYYSKGFPPKPDFDTSLVDVCYKLRDNWSARARGNGSFEPSASDIKGWMANQSVVFLEALEEFETSISAEDAALLGKTYGFAESKNCEVSSKYFRVALRAGDKGAAQPTAELLGKVGRMKFVRPLFRSLTKVDRGLAEETLRKNSSFYHPICRQLVEQDLYGKK
jgi:leukotriene-A4 hydrolase